MSSKTSIKNGASTAFRNTNNASNMPYESPYMRQPKKFSFWRGIYNKDKNYILGRSPMNWGSLLVFYTIFYIILAALFAICMQGLFATLSDREPKWQLDESRIGSNPGLGFRPISENIKHGSLIWYDAKKMEHVSYWRKRLELFLQPYQDSQRSGRRNQRNCDYNSALKDKEVCIVDVSNFGNCTAEHDFGYGKSSPCIFLKLNRIYNWKPEFYDDVLTLPEEMPTDLKIHIGNLSPEKRKQIWVSCSGEKPVDQEGIGPIQYYPSRGFAGYYYPYTNVDGYMSPLIAVQLERPILNRIINIECRAWAKNIEYNGSYRDRQGSVHFELMLD